MKKFLFILFFVSCNSVAGWDFYFSHAEQMFNPVHSVSNDCGSLLNKLNAKYSSVYPNTWAAYACSSEPPIEGTIIYWRNGRSNATWSIIKKYEVVLDGEKVLDKSVFDSETAGQFYSTAFFITLFLFLISFCAGAVLKMFERR